MLKILILPNKLIKERRKEELLRRIVYIGIHYSSPGLFKYL